VPAQLPFISPYENAFQDVSLGQAFSKGISVHNGGRAPFTWTALGLPPGVSIRSALGTTNGNISPGDAEIWGNATVAGLYNLSAKSAATETVTLVKTLTVGVLQLQGRFTTDYPALMAGLLITSLPVIVAYLVFQRHLVRGIVAGAVK